MSAAMEVAQAPKGGKGEADVEAAPAAAAADKASLPPVPFLSLFRTADALDYILMMVGSLAGIANGASW